MKRLLLVAGIAVLLVSCTSSPQPKGAGDSLVIGSFILDFPDGFFNTPATKFDSNVKLQFRNTAGNRRFTMYTSRGIFYFKTNGVDPHIFENFNLAEVNIGSTKYTFGGATINWTISPTPNKVIYLGHIVFTYSAPTEIAHSGREGSYNYQSSASVDWKMDQLKQYLAKNLPEWKDYEIVEYAKK